MADSKQTNVVDAHVFTPEGLYAALQEYGWHISDGIDDCSGTDKAAEFANASGLSLMIREAIDAAVAAERESCAKIADYFTEQCLAEVPHKTLGECNHPECCEQRSMAKACRGIAKGIRARGKETE